MLAHAPDVRGSYGLVERGVEVSPVQEMEWGARHAYFSDPDGNAWQLQAPPAS